MNDYDANNDSYINTILDSGIQQFKALTLHHRTKSQKPRVKSATSTSCLRKNNTRTSTNSTRQRSPAANLSSTTIKPDYASRTRQILGKPLPQFPKSTPKKNVTMNASCLSSRKAQINYQDLYEKLRAKVDQKKAELVKERKTLNEVKKKHSQVEKKEKMYNDLYSSNEKLIGDNENLFNKIVESEEIRKQQEILIFSLQAEYDRLKQYFEKNHCCCNCSCAEEVQPEEQPQPIKKKKKVKKKAPSKSKKKLH